MKFVVPAAVAAIGVGAPAQASVISGTSDAYTAQASASYTSIIGSGGASTGKIFDVTRTAPPTYSIVDPHASMTINVPPSGILAGDVLSVTSGLLTNSIASNVDGGLGSRTTTADSEVANASISLLTPLIGNPLLSITVGAIHQNATASGDFGSMSAFGSLTIEDLVVKLAGVTVYSLLGVNNVAANFQVVNASLAGAGISLYLNQQTPITGPFLEGISTNALHLSFNASLAGLASAQGDVILGHAEAVQGYAPNAVPEPASIAMMGLGAVGAGLAGLRRRKAA